MRYPTVQPTKFFLEFLDLGVVRIARRDRATRNLILQAGRPAVVGFWYRQHRAEFWVDSFLPGPELGNDVVSYDLPSNTEPGMIRMLTFIGNLIGSIMPGLVFGMGFVLLVVLLRLRIGRLWVADLVASTLLTLGTIGPANVRTGTLLMITAMLGIAMNLAILWTLRRFGFLSVLVTWILWQTSVAVPISLTSWYTSRSLTLLAIPIVLSAWALWVIINAQQPSIAVRARSRSLAQ